MKNMKLLRALSAVLALLVVLLAMPAFADSGEKAEESVPFEAVYDRATVLSAETKQLITDLDKKLFDSTGCRVCVVTLDFLDGKHITDVAKGLYASLKLSENDVLTIICVDEFSYTAYAGNAVQKKLDSVKLGQIVGTNLTNQLKEPYTSEGHAMDYPSSAYDSALRAYMPKLCDSISSAFGVSSGYAESLKPTATPAAAAAVTPAPTEKADDSAAYSADNWLDRMMTWGETKVTSTGAPFKYDESDSDKGVHVSFWQIILLLIILKLIFSGKNKGGKNTRKTSGKGGHPYR
ncbi:MAG: TPM domain-containing protein [Eubacteriales bacterium]|nr:TPM domain-containing protein [Eubacteriales bacterium]MDD3883114.1 TPM domain-containing protein [Eubacteriales bacterium]MDD4513316.1 TPM domain-containing protein [Eubacteriales bacterium]